MSCGVLPQDTLVSEMPGAVMPHDSTQCGKAGGTFYIQEFSVTDSGGSRGKVTDVPLQHVWNAHTSGEEHQAYPDGTVRSE